MVVLQEKHLRRFVETWEKAQASGTRLPTTDDQDYASYNALLRHVLRASRGYLIWICEQLELPDPKVEQAPEADAIEANYANYLEYLLGCWRGPLKDVPEESFYRPEYASRWKTKYCIDAMLEHAVMHPIRHRYQLEKLLASQGKA
jgi:uncharacterized damage-inducible protein DinB